MAVRICLAVDIGGSSIKMLTARYDGGKIEIIDQESVPNPPIVTEEHVYINIPNILGAIKGKLKGLHSSGIFPQTMGIDTFGNGYGLLNESLETEVLPYFYKDKRTKGILKKVEERLSLYELYQASGLYPTEVRVVVQLFHDACQPNDPIHSCKWLLPFPDLLNFYLTGCIRAEESMASVANLLDGNGEAWNKELFARLDIPTDIFPPLIKGGTILGALTPAVAEEVGGSLEVVAVTSHDTESALLAVPGLDESCVFASIGTSLIFGTRVNKVIRTEQGYKGAFKTMKGPFHYSLCRDFNAMWLFEKCMQEWRESDSTLSYDDVMAACVAAGENHTYLNVCDPMLRTENSCITEVIKAYCRMTEQSVPETIGEIANCILDSIVLQSLWSFRQVREITKRTSYKKLVAIGGGSKNRLLMQRLADALAIPVVTGSGVSSAFGNVLMQLYATGELADLQQIQAAAQGFSEGATFVPGEGSCDKWENALEVLNKIDNIRTFWR